MKNNNKTEIVGIRSTVEESAKRQRFINKFPKAIGKKTTITNVTEYGWELVYKEYNFEQDGER